jgi:hypothetical protein
MPPYQKSLLTLIYYIKNDLNKIKKDSKSLIKIKDLEKNNNKYYF